jgi:hypothetical protein
MSPFAAGPEDVRGQQARRLVQDTVAIFRRVMLARSVTGIAAIGILNLVARRL